MEDASQPSDHQGAHPVERKGPARHLRASAGVLMPRFREIYGELIDTKTVIIAAALERPPDPALYQRIRARLRRAVGPRGEEGERASLREHQVYNDFRYAVTALIDEQMIYLKVAPNEPWSGAKTWSEKLLEEEFFGSFRAGTKVFDDIDRLLTGENHETLAVEQARIYLLILGLGFRGGLRQREPHDELRGDAHRRDDDLPGYARRLAGFINGGTAKAALPRTVHHGRTVMGPGRKRLLLPSARNWFWGLSAGIMVWLVGSTMIWMYHTSAISSLTRNIERLHKDPERDNLIESVRQDPGNPSKGRCETDQLCGDNGGQCGVAGDERSKTLREICCPKAK